MEKSKKWTDAGYLFERVAFTTEVKFINLEIAEYLVKSKNFDLEYFRGLMRRLIITGKLSDSHTINRSYKEVDCTPSCE